MEFQRSPVEIKQTQVPLEIKQTSKVRQLEATHLRDIDCTVPHESDADKSVEVIESDGNEAYAEGEICEPEQESGLGKLEQQAGRTRTVKEVEVIKPTKPAPTPTAPSTAPTSGESSSKAAAADNGGQGTGGTSKQASGDAGMYVGLSSRVAAASCGPTVTNAAQAAALSSNSALAKVQMKLTDLVLGETVKFTSEFDAESKANLRKAKQHSPLIITIKHIVGDLAGEAVAGLEVTGALTMTNNTFSMTMHVAANPEEYQYNIALYGAKSFEAHWHNGQKEVLVHACKVTIRPSHKTRPRTQYVYHNASNNQPITSEHGSITFSSRCDYRWTAEAPVFADITVPYEGGPVSLPEGLPDALVSIHPNIPGFITTHCDRFILASGECEQSVHQINLSPNDLTKGEWRVVLTWAKEPADLDLYCIRDQRPFKIYHGFKNTGGSKSPKLGMIQLDVDVADGCGPETITFTPQKNVRYRFGVKNFDWKGEPKKPLSESQAQVQVLSDAGVIAVFDVPTAIVAQEQLDGSYKHARSWNVFELIGGDIVPKQIVSLDNILE